MSKQFLRLLTETFFIIFLFYANLLMGEFTRMRLERGITWEEGLRDVCTLQNFSIALAAALIGYLFIEFWRRRLQ